MEFKNSVAAIEPFASMQLSFSTADIEKSVFFDELQPNVAGSEPLANAVILVIHGDMVTLQEREPPIPAVPLTPESGLLRIMAEHQAVQP